jgi:hypothetical protein
MQFAIVRILQLKFCSGECRREATAACVRLWTECRASMGSRPGPPNSPRGSRKPSGRLSVSRVRQQVRWCYRAAERYGWAMRCEWWTPRSWGSEITRRRALYGVLETSRHTSGVCLCSRITSTRLPQLPSMPLPLVVLPSASSVPANNNTTSNPRHRRRRLFTHPSGVRAF